MKFLFDFGPIILFFIVYKSYGLYAAIYAMIAATFVQLMYTRLTTGRFENSHIITFVLLLVFGGISIALRNPAFVMWKVSVLYVIFALALIASNWIGKKTLLERMLGKELVLPRSTWERLNWIWGFGFVGIALVNAYFVNAALSARKTFFDSVQIDTKIELSEVDCSKTFLENLCSNAQQTEQAWVNFKLFGTLGLTLLLIVITVVILSKHIKEKETKL
jgi:intracellular septation protein